ncbi:MAG TPA: archaetidylserine decarboxylase [Croceibacterium sp.]
MSARFLIRAVLGQEHVNFLLTNRIPHHALTQFMGWFSRIEFLPVRTVSIALWKLFCDVDLADAKEARFRSLHAAFVRELKPGARKADPDKAVMVSPCDAIVGAVGRIEAGTALQLKGSPYPIADLLGSDTDAALFRDGWFVTLRLTAGMYHRFHAPHDITVERLRYISGDTWNVNPATLRRIERLFCKNERAPMLVRIDYCGDQVALVPVAAVLVASIRLPWLDGENDVRSKGERVVHSTARFTKGDQMGWFEHGSTIVVLAPSSWRPIAREGESIRTGAPLLTRKRHTVRELTAN